MLPSHLRVNIPEVDTEHNEPFLFLEEFKRYCFEKVLVPLEKRNALRNVLIDHFATEFALAKRSKLDFDLHGKAHANMFKVVSQALDQMSTNNSDLYSLIRYIDYWFEKHILDYDIPMARNITDAFKKQ
jgi:hemerythrin